MNSSSGGRYIASNSHLYLEGPRLAHLAVEGLFRNPSTFFWSFPGQQKTRRAGAGGSEAVELSLRRASARSSLLRIIIARRRRRSGAGQCNKSGHLCHRERLIPCPG